MGLCVLELIIVSTNELQLLAKVNNSTCNQKTILHPSLIQGFVKLFGLQARASILTKIGYVSIEQCAAVILQQWKSVCISLLYVASA